MKCLQCGSNTVVKKAVVYHYTECGLKNIYLRNLRMHACSHCGDEEVVFPNIEELHALIAHDVASQESRLKAEEIRFLRVHLGLSGADFANTLSVEPETVSRWETGSAEMKLTNERFLRLLILAKAGPFREYDDLQSFGSSSKKGRPKLQFSLQGDKWKSKLPRRSELKLQSFEKFPG